MSWRVQEEELAVLHNKRKAREGRTCHSDSFTVEPLLPVETQQGGWAWERMASPVLVKLQGHPKALQDPGQRQESRVRLWPSLKGSHGDS